jgi:hypothetical protein
MVNQADHPQAVGDLAQVLGRIAMTQRTSVANALAALVIALVGCASELEFRVMPDEHTPSPSPAVQARIAAFEAASPDTRPPGIQKVLYNGKHAYLLTSPCCDQFNYLYRAEGVPLCAPSGGIAGHGDGRCKGPITSRCLQVQGSHLPLVGESRFVYGPTLRST